MNIAVRFGIRARELLFLLCLVVLAAGPVCSQEEEGGGPDASGEAETAAQPPAMEEEGGLDASGGAESDAQPPAMNESEGDASPADPEAELAAGSTAERTSAAPAKMPFTSANIQELNARDQEWVIHGAECLDAKRCGPVHQSLIEPIRFSEFGPDISPRNSGCGAVAGRLLTQMSGPEVLDSSAEWYHQIRDAAVGRRLEENVPLGNGGVDGRDVEHFLNTQRLAGTGLEAKRLDRGQVGGVLSEIEQGPVWAHVYSKDGRDASSALLWPPDDRFGPDKPFSHAVTVIGYNRGSNDILYVDSDKNMKSMSYDTFRRIYVGGVTIRPRR